MTLPDPGLDRPNPSAGNIQDRVPSTERGEDPARDAITHDLTTEPARPLTDEEREAAARDVPRPERVYAPASARVPKEPLPGHRDVVEHADTETPERQQAGGQSDDADDASGEPPFTRVTRPSQASADTTPTPSPYASSETNPGYAQVESSDATSRPYQADSADQGGWGVPGGRWSFGSLALLAAAGLGVWLFVRWQRERNRPVNRLRRQARQAAARLRERVPSTDDVDPPLLGLLAGLASAALVILRRLQGQTAAGTVKQTSQSISDADWQTRLAQLKERWSPRRLELEKVSISRH